MPEEIYEVVAKGARYWFLFLMALIVWRSYRWYRRDNKQRKKRMRLLPDAGFVGEMVVLKGGEGLERGDVLPVPREGTLGTLRTNDLCVPISGVAKRHLWFRFDDGDGLMIEPFRGKKATVDSETFQSRRHPLYMAHGSRLYVGEAELRLRLFAGFEAKAHRREALDRLATEDPDEAAPETEQVAANQAMLQQLWMQQQMLQQYAQQQAYQQWAAQQWAAQQAQQGANGADDEQGEQDEVYNAPNAAYDPSAEVDDAFDTSEPIVFDTDEPFYPPVGEDDDGDIWPYAVMPQTNAVFENSGYTYPEYVEPDELDEDMTDAAVPPKSAYIGHDEAELAKKKLWDKYLGGGQSR